MRFPSRDCILASCAVLLLLVIVQISVIAIGYESTLQYSTPYSQSYGNLDESVVISLRQKRLPSCLIIGVRKGGTRALVDALSLHPLIRTARKEIHFFNQNETYSKGIEWYKQQMPEVFPHQIAIEKTPGYFTSELAPKRVAELNREMKIILILRNPVTRTISDFTQVYHNKLDLNKTLPIFEEVIFLNGTKRINPEYKPIRNSLYSLHLSNWLRYFPREQILVLDGDKFAVDPLSELRIAETFLFLPHLIEESQLVWDENKGFHCFKKNKTKPPRCLGDSKGRVHHTVSEDTKRILRSQFRSYNRKLFQMMNRKWHW